MPTTAIDRPRTYAILLRSGDRAGDIPAATRRSPEPADDTVQMPPLSNASRSRPTQATFPIGIVRDSTSLIGPPFESIVKRAVVVVLVVPHEGEDGPVGRPRGLRVDVVVGEQHRIAPVLPDDCDAGQLPGVPDLIGDEGDSISGRRPDGCEPTSGDQAEATPVEPHYVDAGPGVSGRCEGKLGAVRRPGGMGVSGNLNAPRGQPPLAGAVRSHDVEPVDPTAALEAHAREGDPAPVRGWNRGRVGALASAQIASPRAVETNREDLGVRHVRPAIAREDDQLGRRRRPRVAGGHDDDREKRDEREEACAHRGHAERNSDR